MIIIITNHNIKNTGRAEMRILLSSSQVGRWLSLAVGAVSCRGTTGITFEQDEACTLIPGWGKINVKSCHIYLQALHDKGLRNY